MKLGFKKTISWNKYQSKVIIEKQSQYLGYLIDTIFQGVNRFFVLSFEHNAVRTGHREYFLLKVEIKDYNVIMIDEKLCRSASKK